MKKQLFTGAALLLGAVIVSPTSSFAMQQELNENESKLLIENEEKKEQVFVKSELVSLYDTSKNYMLLQYTVEQKKMRNVYQEYLKEKDNEIFEKYKKLKEEYKNRTLFMDEKVLLNIVEEKFMNKIKFLNDKLSEYVNSELLTKREIKKIIIRFQRTRYSWTYPKPNYLNTEELKIYQRLQYTLKEFEEKWTQ